MSAEQIREILEEHNYILYYIDPDMASHEIFARIFRTICDERKAKKVVFYWAWVNKKCNRKFNSYTVQLLDAVGMVIDKSGGRYFKNLKKLWEFTERVNESNKRNKNRVFN
jgi:hypothetical protein